MTNISTDKTSDGNDDEDWAGGDGYLIVKGDFDGASVVVVGITDDDGEEIHFEKEATFTVPSAQQFSFPAGKLRAKQINSGAATSLTAQVFAR